jgi:hypothetical protein
MNLWEKTLFNLNRGYDRVTAFAAALSERVKAEIDIIRLRMQLDEVRKTIEEEHRAIGRKLYEMRQADTLPETFDAFFRNDDIADSLEKIDLQEKAMENLRDDLAREADVLKQDPQQPDEERTA